MLKNRWELLTIFKGGLNVLAVNGLHEDMIDHLPRGLILIANDASQKTDISNVVINYMGHCLKNYFFKNQNLANNLKI